MDTVYVFTVVAEVFFCEGNTMARKTIIRSRIVVLSTRTGLNEDLFILLCM